MDFTRAVTIVAKEGVNMSLTELLIRDAKAAAFYESLHPSVREIVDADAKDIVLDEDLYAAANNAMTERLREVQGIFDDSARS